MATAGPITATEILGDIVDPIEPSFAPEFARMVLQLHFSDTAQDQIREFLSKSNAGTLNPTEKAALDNYLLVGQFVDLLQAKARVSLQGRNSPR